MLYKQDYYDYYAGGSIDPTVHKEWIGPTTVSQFPFWVNASFGIDGYSIPCRGEINYELDIPPEVYAPGWIQLTYSDNSIVHIPRSNTYSQYTNPDGRTTASMVPYSPGPGGICAPRVRFFYSQTDGPKIGYTDETTGVLTWGTEYITNPSNWQYHKIYISTSATEEAYLEFGTFFPCPDYGLTKTHDSFAMHDLTGTYQTFGGSAGDMYYRPRITISGYGALNGTYDIDQETYPFEYGVGFVGKGTFYYDDSNLFIMVIIGRHERTEQINSPTGSPILGTNGGFFYTACLIDDKSTGFEDAFCKSTGKKMITDVSQLNMSSVIGSKSCDLTWYSYP